MLTNNKNIKLPRKDRPWLLFLTAVLWICGSTFFHDPWEPYEPFVVAIVKSIITSNNWLIPYIAPNFPYLDLQPFYFWLFAIPIKLLHFTNIANAVRLINAVIIFATIYMISRVGSSLSAYKNGRTTVMILISMIGFINEAYQISPNLIVLLGFVLYLFALQRMKVNPGGSLGIMAVALFFISINFTAQNLYIALFILLILPLVSSHWRCRDYALVSLGGTSIFALFFAFYAWQLYSVDILFFHVWTIQYMHFVNLGQNVLSRYLDLLILLSWYLVPGGILAIWTLYRRKKQLFNDPILSVSLLLAILILAVSGISKGFIGTAVFPILIPVVLLASVEVDSIKIHFVSLFNWFSIFVFGFAGIAVASLYFSLNFHLPERLYDVAKDIAPDYAFNFNIWQVLLAIIILAIWLFMVTRKHIRGREVISNWASGMTFVLIMFMSLCIPWFNSVLSFRSLVGDSMNYINKTENICIASTNSNKIQDAIWYYYAGIRLRPETNLNNTQCKQAIITTNINDDSLSKYTGWHVVWSGKRSIDLKKYYLIERDDSSLPNFYTN